MNGGRWHAVRALFDAALEQRQEQRAAFLSARSPDAEVRAAVEDLLRAAATAGDFLETPAVGQLDVTLGQPEQKDDDSVVVPQRIGAYQVIRRVGVGGMGSVFLARRLDAPQAPEVAVKVIKRGMDSEFVVGRFRHERQILASLDHPNIARLLDGGTTDDGLPYFVMEYIEGEAVDEYCGRHGLTVNQRLDLFLQICAAVSYAHRHLVVHRDIKPKNILVTRDGVPKLLDFGLAKVLSPEPAEAVSRTATALRMLTPNYASPEQVRGDPITTATDVYSLGVVLYELLAGCRPYRISHHSSGEIARVVCEVEPERPPKSARVPADLSTIALTALRKEPQRRFASVDHLAEDIGRYRSGLPVSARKDTFGYRAGKFLRRHRAGVAAAVVVLLAIVGGLTATTWQARVAETERARAERRYRDLRRLAGTLLFELDEAIADLPGSTRARELLVKRALEYLSALEQESGEDLSLQRELAVAFSRVGEVQARGFGLDLGEITGALASFHKGMLIRQRLVDADPTNLQDQDDLAESLLRISQVMGQMGEAADNISYAHQAVTIREVLVASAPDRLAFRAGLAAAYETLGGALMRDVDLEGMLEAFTKLLALRQELLRGGGDSVRSRCDLADALLDVGLAQELKGDRSAALASWLEAESVLEALAAEAPGSERVRSSLLRTFTQIGGSLNASGQKQQALECLRHAVALGETLHATDPGNAEVRHRLSETYLDLGTTLADIGARAEASEVLGKARELLERWWRAHPWNARIAVTLAGVYEGLGLASEPPPGPRSAARDAAWRRAYTWYLRSLDVWHNLSTRECLAPLYRSRTERVAEAVLRCNAALAPVRRSRRKVLARAAR